MKSNMTLKTKKILLGVGIVFGTIVVFLLSFALSFSLIVNPISLFSFGDADTIKENEELKEQVQILTDEVEMLNVTVDKYKANQSATPIVVTPDPQAQQNSSPSSQQSPSTQPQTNPGETSSATTPTEDNNFSPETVTETDMETPEDVEEPITVIDLS